MAYCKVEICGIDTNALQVLSEAEKTRLLTLAKQGDDKAREKLIDGNLRLVLSVIQRFMNRKELPDDLFQVGCIGLMKAIDNFDLTIGVRFSTYAVPMIIGELRRFMRDTSSVRVSRSLRDLSYKAMQAKERLQNKLGREPRISEIAKESGEEIADIVIALESSLDTISLSEPIYSEGEDSITLADQLRDSDCEQNWITEIGLREAIASLAERERMILELRYLYGKTQTEVSERIGISQAQVSRLEKNALKKIKESM